MKLLNTKSVLASLLAATVFAGCAFNQSTPKETAMISNKEKAVQLLTSIETGDPKPVGYINPNKYIQHNLAVKDGLAGFAEVMAQLPEGSAKAKVVRAFQDGEYVFTHTEYDFFGPKIGFDIFRFEEGKIVEHWDNLQTIVEKTSSGRSQIDGPTKVNDLDKTQSNKALVQNFVNDVLFGKAPNKITEYISTEQYDQHNPYVKDGLQGLGEAIEYLSSQNDMFIYQKTHKVLGEGNFILTVSEGSWHGKPHAFYDLFRVENSKIVEHWDTIEEIPSQEKHANSNGKF
mgnify:CR=1 FL=1